MSGSPLVRWRRELLALLCALGLGAIMTWPTVIDPAGGMIGHPGNDTWNHAWGMWWVFEGLREGRVPLHTGLLNYPDGGSLFFIDSFNALWSAPFQAVLGLPATFNLVVTLGLAWTLFCGWLLARHVLRDDSAAAVAGVVFGCSAHLLGQAYNGITETVNAGWIALFLLALLRLMDRPRLGRALALGVAFGVCALSNFYYGLFAALLTLVVVLHTAITDASRVKWLRFLALSSLSVVVSAVIALPVLLVLSGTMGAEDAMVIRDPEFVWRSLLRHNISDLISFFRPGKHYSPDLKADYGEDLIIVTYLGWVALGLATVALAMHRRRRNLSLWVWVFVVCFLFALGPYLHVNGEYIRLSGRRIPLPFLPFFEAFPLFSRISHPFRFVVPAMLGLGILAAHGARYLVRGLDRGKQRMAIGVMCAAIMAEVLLASPAVWPMPRSDAHIPDVYGKLVEEGAVLDLPITVPNLERAVYTYFQTRHGRPSPYGLNEPVPRHLWSNRLTQFLVYLEAGRAITLPRMLPDLELVAGARRLKAQGYRYVVVHQGLYTRHKAEMVDRVLSAVLGTPSVYPEDGLTVYELQP